MTMTTYRGSGSRSVVAAAGACRLPMPKEAIGSGITAGKWRVLCEAIWPAAKSQAAIMLAVDYCKARNLDPLKRPVHIVPMYSTVLERTVETVWPGINEIQVTASRTGQWAGMDAPKWGPDVTMTWDYKPQKGPAQSFTVTFPDWCEVTVYRLVGGERRAFTEVVYWLEAYARISRWTDAPNDMWRRRSRGQLHKCAKAAVLRAAFPECASDYAAEEMEGKDIEAAGPVIEGQHGPTDEAGDRGRYQRGQGEDRASSVEDAEQEPESPAKQATIPLVYNGNTIEEHPTVGDWWGSLKRNWDASRAGTSNPENLSLLKRHVGKITDQAERDRAEKMLADMEEDAEAELPLLEGGDPAKAREMSRNLRAG